MIFTISLNQYNINNIFFCDQITNNIVQNAFFSKIIYSTSYLSFSGLYINIPLTINTKFDNQNQKYHFDKNDEYIIISNFLKNIENSILTKFNDNVSKNLSCSSKLFDIFNSGNLRIYNDSNKEKKTISNIVLKISGIWSNDNTCGLTYKFLNV